MSYIYFCLVTAISMWLPLFSLSPPRESNLSLEQWSAYTVLLHSEPYVSLPRQHFFFSHKKTNLPFSIEKDPSINSWYIHLGDVHSNKLGRGHHKRVTKSILYNGENSQVVARCESDDTGFDEAAILKRLKNQPGVIQLISSIRRSKNNIDIFLQYYPTGSLLKVEKKSVQLNQNEYLTIMYDIVRGLKSIHDNGFMHRDLHRGNILIDRTGTITRAAITDFGQAIPITKERDISPSVPKSGCPPESLLVSFSRLNRKKAEAYAIGVSVYVMMFQRKPAWSSLFNYWKLHQLSLENRHHLYHKIVSVYNKGLKKAKSLPNGLLKDIALLTYQLLHPNPKQRIPLSSAIQEIKKIATNREIALPND